MTTFSMFVEQCVEQPSADLMERAYRDYVDDSEHPTAASIKEKSAPCKDPSITNQCAVRMSVALARCGFDLEGFQPRRRVHIHNHICQLTIPHVVGAEELARYLKICWPVYQVFKGRTRRTAAATIADQKGVVYFNNCFHRNTDAEGKRTGDHIDFWDGVKYFNEYIHVSAGGTASASSPLFEKADEIWFFGLM